MDCRLQFCNNVKFITLPLSHKHILCSQKIHTQVLRNRGNWIRNTHTNKMIKQMWQKVKKHLSLGKGDIEISCYSYNFSISLKLFQIKVQNYIYFTFVQFNSIIKTGEEPVPLGPVFCQLRNSSYFRRQTDYLPVLVFLFLLLLFNFSYNKRI